MSYVHLQNRPAEAAGLWLAKEKLNEALMEMNKAIQVPTQISHALITLLLIRAVTVDDQCRKSKYGARCPDVQELSVKRAVPFGRYVRPWSSHSFC